MGTAVLRNSTVGVSVIAAAFLAGFSSHLLYQRWSREPQAEEQQGAKYGALAGGPAAIPPATYSVSHVPVAAPTEKPAELPFIQAREVEKLRERAGSPARIRGRIFRVGHSEKSNTYFLNFGPSREALTAVIFASAVELFEKDKAPPKNFDGREVEVTGEIKNHPQYGLEVILENPSQIKVVNQ
jgi:hypothetical protein